ncbi:hypothetical protein ILUMI_10810, partial [Ignelater luminosus]
VRDEFGTPSTDVCSYCERLKNKIKQANNADAKRTACRELNVHRIRAKQFNLLMKKEDAGTTTFCFDLQQIQNLPKIPIQEAYYSLQIAFYSFCIVDINAKEPIFYTWNEVQSGRGSNEQFGEVQQLGTDWLVYDFKGLLETLKKMEGITDDPSKKFNSLLKRGKKLENASLKEVTEQHGITQEKGKAVNNLLQKSFGEEWYHEDYLSWYFEVLRDFIMETVDPEEFCECMEAETELKL